MKFKITKVEVYMQDPLVCIVFSNNNETAVSMLTKTQAKKLIKELEELLQA